MKRFEVRDIDGNVKYSGPELVDARGVYNSLDATQAPVAMYEVTRIQESTSHEEERKKRAPILEAYGKDAS